MTSEQTQAWQTYMDQARSFLADAQVINEHPITAEFDPIRLSQANAQAAIGWALLALVEVLKPSPRHR